MKSSGCSSGSTIIWFATLLLPFRIFSAYSIVAPPIPSVLVSTIAKIHLWWNWKLHDNRHWIKGMVARVEALLCDLPPFYCQIEFLVHIALSLLQFVLYWLPPLLSLILDGIGSFVTSVKRWKGVVARVEALLSDSPPFYCRYDFSVHIALALLHFLPYSFPTLLRFIYGGIGSFATTVIG